VDVSKKKQVVVEEPIVEDPPDDEVEPETVAAVEYPHCACGAVLALDPEQAAGKCEACAPLEIAARTVSAETTAAPSDSAPSTEDVKPEGTPVDVPLPFPPAPFVPFDFHAAFVDIGKHNREVEARQKTWLELNERAKDSKKQWEAAASSLTLAIAEYDRKARESEEAEARQEKLEAAYVEKLEAAAAEKAQPELPVAAAVQTAAERVPDLATATPLSDALPACQCGHALALDTERARGTCDECAF
jgi:hypothetical protein